MRTTMTVDDDVLRKLKTLAVRRNMSLKEAINTTLRRGLASQELDLKNERFVVEAFRSRVRPGVDLEKLNALSDEVETRHAMNGS